MFVHVMFLLPTAVLNFSALPRKEIGRELHAAHLSNISTIHARRRQSYPRRGWVSTHLGHGNPVAVPCAASYSPAGPRMDPPARGHKQRRRKGSSGGTAGLCSMILLHLNWGEQLLLEVVVLLAGLSCSLSQAGANT